MLAIRTNSVPPAWWDDDRMVLTLVDVLNEADEETRRASRGR